MNTLDQNDNHKHCVFCGERITTSTVGASTCRSPLNPLPPDTVGNKHHAFPAVDNKQRAQEAADRARATVTIDDIQEFSI